MNVKNEKHVAKIILLACFFICGVVIKKLNYIISVD